MKAQHDYSEHTSIDDDLDAEWLHRIRSTYHAHPPFKVDPAPSRTSRNWSPLMAAASVAVLIGTGSLVLGTHGERPAATADHHGSSFAKPAPVSGPPGDSLSLNKTDETTANRLRKNLYHELDARPDLGFYMLALDPERRRVDFWTPPTFGTDVTDTLQSLSSRSGYSFDTHQVPPSSRWPQSAQSRASATANAVRQTLERSGSDSHLAALKIETPLHTIVVWATHANAMRSRLKDIGRAHRTQVEIYEAPMSQASARALGVRLRARNATWQAHGFAVSGAYATGSGPVVVVTGDLRSAQSTLSGRRGILAITLDRGVPISLTVPTP